MDIGELVKVELKKLGVDVKADAKEVRGVIRQATQLLAAAINEPDYEGSKLAAAEWIMLASTGKIIRRADSLDNRAWNFIDGLLIGRVA
jgi:hypothetical protein